MAFNFEQFGTEVTEPKKKVGGFDFESFGTEVVPEKEQPKKSIFRRAGEFLTSSEKGVAEATAALKPTFTREQATQAGQSADQLIARANVGLRAAKEEALRCST